MASCRPGYVGVACLRASTRASLLRPSISGPMADYERAAIPIEVSGEARAVPADRAVRNGIHEVRLGPRNLLRAVRESAGKPALFVHGGPGAGGDVNARRFFDPKGYRIVVFDQRGSGRSRPHASLEAIQPGISSPTSSLCARILGIARWLVFGGSWGSTLALAYAQAHPAAVSELVLARHFFAAPLGARLVLSGGREHGCFPSSGKSISRRSRRRSAAIFSTPTTGDCRAGSARAARGGARVVDVGRRDELALAESRTHGQFGEPEFALALARIEAHYFVESWFLLQRGPTAARRRSRSARFRR